jgi:peptidoglycan/xylan/chitin deacetylase (PgdA/CDA1 family)
MHGWVRFVAPGAFIVFLATGLLAPRAGTDVVSAVTTGSTAIGPPPTATIAAAPSRFSPNGDGRFDRMTVTVAVDGPAAVTVEARRDGVLLDTVLDLVADRAGSFTARWDGRTATGVRVGDGRVRLALTATADGLVTTAGTAVVIDTRGPTVTWRSLSPEPQLGTGPMTARFRLGGEVHPVTVWAQVTDRFRIRDESAPRRRLLGDREFAWRPTYRNGMYLFPGLYRMRIVARDDVGNRTRGRWRPFRVHRPVTNRAVERYGGTGNRVALTFDGCYEPVAWDRILRTLAARGVHASFFCVSSQVARHPELARRTVAAGHTIGSHTPDHPHVIGLSQQAIIDRLRADQRTWWQVAGVTTSPFWRVPYGEHSPSAETAAGRAGFRWTAFWAVDTIDWEYPGVATITSRALRARGGDIVLMHVLGDTATALPGIIGGLRAQGLAPVSLEELVHVAGLDHP